MNTTPSLADKNARSVITFSEKEQFDYSRWFDDFTEIQREMALRNIASVIQYEAEIMSYRLDDLEADIESIDVERYSDLKTISHLLLSAAEILSKINRAAMPEWK